MDLSMLLERVEDPVYDRDEVVNLEPGSQSTLENRIQTLKVHKHTKSSNFWLSVMQYPCSIISKYNKKKNI